MENCPSCKVAVNDTHRFCPSCGRELPGDYTNPLGWWKVTTEGDVEGRSVTDLGTHYGYLDEIAKVLSGLCYYSLNFKKIRSPETLPTSIRPTKTKVAVTLDIGSGLWESKPAERANTVARYLQERPVRVLQGQYYASVDIVFDQEPIKPNPHPQPHHLSKAELLRD